MAEKKLCPLMTLGAMSGNYSDTDTYCKEGDCAWWTSDKECAVVNLAENLTLFRNSGMPINNHY